MVTCLSPNGSTTYSASQLPDRLLIATVSGVVTAARDESGFHVINQALAKFHISSLCFEPTRRAIFASSYAGGIHVSHDGGETWQRTARVLEERNVYTVASRTEGDSVILYAGTEPVGLFESTDYGENWIELRGISELPNSEKWTFPPPPHDAHLKNLVFDERDPSLFYACIEQGGLFKTVDGGRTWVEMESIVQADDEAYKDVHRLVIHPEDPNTMFMTGGDGLSVSQDTGRTWRRVEGRSYTIGYPDGLVINPLDPSLMFLSGSRSSPGSWRSSHNADAHVARSQDGGASWQIVASGFPDPLRGNIEALSLSVSPTTSELFAATTDGDVYSSTDAGEHFFLVLKDLGAVSKAGHYRNLVPTA